MTVIVLLQLPGQPFVSRMLSVTTHVPPAGGAVTVTDAPVAGPEIVQLPEVTDQLCDEPGGAEEV